MKKTMDKITTVTDKLCVYVSYFSMLTVVIMMIIVSADVLFTKLNHPLPGMYELCQVILSTFVFSSWAYTQTVHGHIHVVMFISKMPQVLRFICFSVTSLLSCVVMAFASYSTFMDIFGRYKTLEKTGTLLIPYWPFIIFEFVAFLLLTIILFRDAVKSLIAIGNKEMAEEIQAEWV